MRPDPQHGTGKSTPEQQKQDMAAAAVERLLCPCCRRPQHPSLTRFLWTSFNCPQCQCPLTIKTPRLAVFAGFAAAAIISLLLAGFSAPQGLQAMAATWVKAFVVLGLVAGFVIDRAFGSVILSASPSTTDVDSPDFDREGRLAAAMQGRPYVPRVTPSVPGTPRRRRTDFVNPDLPGLKISYSSGGGESH